MKTSLELEDYLDAEVMDIDGKLTGSLLCFWQDEEGGAIFVGIKASWNRERTIIVPIELTEPNEYHCCVLVRASKEQLRGAPTLSCEEALPQELEDEAYRYFDVPPPTSRARLQLNKAAALKKLHGS